MIKKFTLFIFIAVFGVNAVGAEVCASELMRLRLPTRDFQETCKTVVKTDPVCLRVPEEKRLKCGLTQDQNKILSTSNIGTKLGACLKAFFIDSMVDLAKFVGHLFMELGRYAGKGMTDTYKILTDPQYRARKFAEDQARNERHSKIAQAFISQSAANFSREFPKNMAKHPFDPAMALGATLFTPVVNLITDAVTAIAENYFEELKCMNGEAKAASLCKIAGTLFMPPLAIFTFMRGGKAGLALLSKNQQFIKMLAKTKAGFAQENRVVRALVQRAEVAVVANNSRSSLQAAQASGRGGAQVAQTAGRGAGQLARAVAKDSAEAGTAARTGRVANQSNKDIEAIAFRLDDSQRIKVAEQVLGRKLTLAQSKELLEIHNIGADRTGNFTRDQIKEKFDRLLAMGLTKPEVEAVMRNGIAGTAPNAATPLSYAGVQSSTQATRSIETATQVESSINWSGNAQEIRTGVEKVSLEYRTAAAELGKVAAESGKQSDYLGSISSYARAGESQGAAIMARNAIDKGVITKNNLLNSLQIQLEGAQRSVASGNQLAMQRRDVLRKLIGDLNRSDSGAPTVTAAVKTQEAVATATKVEQAAAAGARTESARQGTSNFGRATSSAARVEPIPAGNFNSQTYAATFNRSLSTTGETARAMTQEAAKNQTKLNEFVSQLHQLNIHSSKDPAIRRNLAATLDEINKLPPSQRALYTPQADMLRTMNRATQVFEQTPQYLAHQGKVDDVVKLYTERITQQGWSKETILAEARRERMTAQMMKQSIIDSEKRTAAAAVRNRQPVPRPMPQMVERWAKDEEAWSKIIKALEKP
ncbi:MAG: hypothetical protein V4736_04395 [Bdellovibrionota bacterium]